MGLLGGKPLERGPLPGMAHRWDIALMGRGFSIVHIKVLRLCCVIRNNIQDIDLRVINRAEKIAVESTDNHDFCALAIMDLAAVMIKHTVICVLELDAVAAVHGPLIKNREDQVDFFLGGLIFKYRFDKMGWDGELIVEFFNVGVQEFISSIPVCDACQPEFDRQTGLERLIEALHPSFRLGNDG